MIAWNADFKFEGDVSVGKGCKMPPFEDFVKSAARFCRFCGFLARSATARFPCAGFARTLATPAPDVGPAPMRIAIPDGAIVMIVAVVVIEYLKLLRVYQTKASLPAL